MTNIIILVCSQILFTITDVMAHAYLRTHGFHLTSFLAPWFAIYVVLKIIATFGVLYILANVDLAKAMSLLAASSLILVNVLGVLMFQEILPVVEYAAVMLAILAFLIIAVVR